MSNDVAQEKSSNIDFAALKLKPGSWLQLHNIEGAPHKTEVEFVSSMHGKSIFVAMPETAANGTRIKAGEQYLVRGFNGVSDFSFPVAVIEIQTQPFRYAHLTYPYTVESRVVREVLRLKASLPSIVIPGGGSKQVSATVNDLSVAGALIESAEPLGVVGDRVEIRISTQFEAKKTELKIPAVIRHAAKWDPEHSYRSGIEFVDIAREDKLVLYYLLFTLSQNER